MNTAWIKLMSELRYSNLNVEIINELQNSILVFKYGLSDFEVKSNLYMETDYRYKDRKKKSNKFGNKLGYQEIIHRETREM